jgi:hypothetical protein
MDAGHSFWIGIGVVVLWGVVAWTLFIPWLAHRRSLRPFEIPGPTRSEDNWAVVGGIRYPARIGVFNATWPFARLTADAAGITLGSSSRILRRLIPTWHFEWRQIARIEVVTFPILGFGAQGVRLWPANTNTPIVFSTFRRLSPLFDLAHQAHIAINRDPQRVWFGVRR